jgi:hypothetical protein
MLWEAIGWAAVFREHKRGVVEQHTRLSRLLSCKAMSTSSPRFNPSTGPQRVLHVEMSIHKLGAPWRCLSG